MRKFDAVISKYITKGISTDNIEYAVNAVKNGTRREHILESLTADYRGVDASNANALLEDLFVVNGGEFKKENRGGYLFGSMFLLVGLSAAFYIIYVLLYGGILIKPILVIIAAVGGITGGVRYFYKALKGQFRDEHQPFGQP